MKFTELDNSVQVIISIGAIVGMIWAASQVLNVAVTVPKVNAEDIEELKSKSEVYEERYNKHVESAYKDFRMREQQQQVQPDRRPPPKKRRTTTTLRRRPRRGR